MHSIDVQCSALYPCQVMHGYSHLQSWEAVQKHLTASLSHLFWPVWHLELRSPLKCECGFLQEEEEVERPSSVREPNRRADDA